MRYIVTTNRHIQLIEDNDNGKILDSKGFQFGQLYYRIVKGKVTFYHFDQEHPWRNDVWSADIPLQINGELYENEEEVGNKLYEVMEDSLFDKIEDLIKEDARLDQKIGDEIDRAKEEEVKLSDKVDGLEDEIDAIDHKVDGYDEKIKANENKINGLDDKLEKEILRSSEKDAEHDAFVNNFSSNLEEEVERAKDAESALTQALNSEIQRAISAETEIANDLDAEVTRATNRENEIENKLNSEITRSTEKDAIHDEKLANLDTSLQNEIERATEAENSLKSDLNSEVSRATAEENRIDAKIDKEIVDRIADVDAEEARALSAETKLESKIDGEITRSTNKDTEHDEKIASLEQADENITNAINSEIQRALSAETSLRDDLNGEITRANGEETRIEGLLANEINRSTAKDTEHDDKIANLEDGLSEEIARAKSEEKRVDDKLDKEIADRTSDVDAEEARASAAEKAISDKLNKEITRSTEKDSSHDSLISGLTTSLHSEIERATNAENSLRSDLNTEISARTNADAAQLQRITALEVGKADANSVYTKTESDAKYTTKDSISDITGDFFDAAAYDSQTKKINFYHGDAIKANIDASSFIKDGMVDNVAISGSNLVITFNTDAAGKEPISIPLSSIFDPSNYFTKSEIDSALSGKVDNSTFNTLSGRVDTISGDVITVSGRVDTISGDVDKVKQEIITFSGDSYSKSEVDTKLGNKADLSAFTAHTADSTVHVTSSEKNTWNNKSDFSGSYNDLTDKPTIRNYSAGTNVQIQNDVISATDTKYTAGSGIKITGPANKIALDVDVYKGNGMLSVSVNNPSGTENTSNKINGMSSFGAGYMVSTNNVDEAAFGYYNETNGNENSFTHSSSNTLFSVGNGNGQNFQGSVKNHNAFEIRQNGDIYIADTNDTTYTHAWEKPMIKLQDALDKAGSSGITSGQVQTMIDKSISGKTNQSDFTAHTANTTVHVTAAEKNTWNAKSDFSGDYNDLTNKPTIPNYTSGSGITISNNVISAKIWSGTRAQYDAITTKDADTIYLIYNS